MSSLEAIKIREKPRFVICFGEIEDVETIFAPMNFSEFTPGKFYTISLALRMLAQNN
jgi:hypothetical protein